MFSKNLNLTKSRFKSNIIYNNYMTNTLRTNLIVAVDSEWGISKQNCIPWKLKEDSNFFNDVTKRQYIKNKPNAVIMGKNTWKALPDTFRGLKDRINVVVSSSMTDDELNADNVTKSESYVVKTLNDGIELCNKLDLGKIFIGGGSSIYKEALEKVNIDEIYLTQIKGNFDCDNKFPGDILNSILPEYKEYSAKTFDIIDHNTGKVVETTFTKYYKGDLPMHLGVNKEEQQYLDLLEDILSGHFRQTRNSTVWSKFGKTIEFDLANGFPMLSTKKMFFRGAFEELMFFLKGDTNTKHLSEIGVKIWDANTSREFLDSVGLSHYEEGDMGEMYSFNFLHFGLEYKGMTYNHVGGFNQIEYCLNLLKKDPFSRRILLTSFNPATASKGCLYPCHSLIMNWHVEENHRLSLSCYNRSQDMFLGNPINAISHCMLLLFFCEVINNDPNYSGPKFTPGRLIMNLGDVHIYEDHYEQCIRQILREPFAFSKLNFKRKVTNLTDFKFEDLELIDYECYPTIVAKMVA